VLVFAGDRPPEVRQPGETLQPHWQPWRRDVSVLPVTTAVIPLRVRVAELDTFDGHRVDEVSVLIEVQLDPADGFAAAAGLAITYGPGFGEQLLRQVHGAVEAGVRGAFRMNRLADLQRSGVAAVLADRWLPTTYAAGALLRRGLEVPEVAWPGSAPVVPVAPDPHRRRHPVRSEVDLELSMDARLRRIWRRRCDAPLLGIAGARVDGGSAVVAATDEPPGAYEQAELRDDFAAAYEDRALTLAVVAAGNYQELVLSWLTQTEPDDVRLYGVDVLRDGDLLRIRLDRPLRRGAAVEALRRLLPQRHVELTAVPGLP
jgi:hypothetical protein